MSDNATVEIMLWAVGQILKGLGVLALIGAIFLWLSGVGVGVWLNHTL